VVTDSLSSIPMRAQILYARSNQLEGVVDHANMLMAGEGFREVKNVAGNRTGFLCVDGETFFIRRFRARSWIKGVLEKFRGSRASRSLRGAEILKRHGFLGPAPLAAAEQVWAGSVRDSWLVSEALEQARSVRAFLDRQLGGPRNDRRWRRQVLGQIAACIRRMHEAGLFISNLQETNIDARRARGRTQYLLCRSRRVQKDGRGLLEAPEVEPAAARLQPGMLSDPPRTTALPLWVFGRGMVTGPGARACRGAS
jgi:hypothetical protein